jgi:hypothetical protein
MLTLVLTAVGLVVATVAIHAVGFAILIRVMVRLHALDEWGFRIVTRMVIGLTCWLMLIHVAEIGIWGLYYFWQGCIPDAESAFYYSAATYATVSCDLALPMRFRMLAPLEALTAILMCGLSTGLFFALVSRWISNWRHQETVLEAHTAASLHK